MNSPKSWYKYVPDVQRYLNSSYQQSIGSTPLELLVGTEMRNKEDLRLRQLIEAEYRSNYIEERETAREEARAQISRVQEENRRNFNRKRKEPTQYEIGELVAIKRTQFGTGLKFCPKYLGPYRITSVNAHDRYEVTKESEGEGPGVTTTSADYMKPWKRSTEELLDSSGSDEEQEGRVVGCENNNACAEEAEEGGGRRTRYGGKKHVETYAT